MLAVNNLTIRFAGEAIFSGISFMIKPKDRIGLTGKNGAGKTSLLKILTGELEASEGDVSKPGNCSIAYLPQHILFKDTGNTVLQEARSAFPEIVAIDASMEKLTKSLNEREDYESEGYEKIIQSVSELSERRALLNADSIEGQIEKTMRGLGFLPGDMHRNTAEFSGGWRMRIELAKLLLSQPNVLMLDEPTNHLDIESIQWLEDFLINYQGAIILISHDRLFLDHVTKRTVELELGNMYDYPASFTKYEIMREERLTLQKAALDNQQKKIADTERFVEKFRYKATKAKQVQSRVKQLEKTEKIDIEVTDNSKIHFRFPPAPRSGAIVIETKHLSKSYGELQVLKDVNFILERGDKVAFVGRNGEGKTTLSRIIMKQLQFVHGELIHGHNLDIGYYAQNQDEMLDNNKTVFQTLDDEAVGDVRKNIRGILGAFMFSGDDIDKRVSILSGGERSRLALAKLLLKPHNLLVLDEPTNHLDIRSKDVLKQALQEYDGSLIIVSHDRYFLDGLTEIVYEFKQKNIKQHLGGISAFIERRRIENLQSLNAAKQIKQAQKSTSSGKGKQDYKAKKAKEKQRRKLQRLVDESEKNIETFEQELTELETLMAKPENANQEHFDKYHHLSQKLNQAMEVWDKVQQALEKFDEKNP
ncbi:MAG: ABC-F family ATP-binding cassette domain-containing protein [Bacteroidota bacterium]|nr:ABC-F family ATP-binding cassette domain-containing protein [Bacteroidota bacterium]